jgi:hypothetical protein
MQPTYPTPAPPPEERSASASTTTLPPLETEFLADLDFGMQNGMGDAIDWDALMNDGELWNNFGGAWNAEGGEGEGTM